MDILVIVVLCAALVGIGVVLGTKTNANAPKKAKTKNLKDASDDELMLLFVAVGCELEKRGIAERVDKNPFDELKK